MYACTRGLNIPSSGFQHAIQFGCRGRAGVVVDDDGHVGEVDEAGASSADAGPLASGAATVGDGDADRDAVAPATAP